VFETNGRIFGSPVIIGDSVFIGSNDGRLYEIDMESGRSHGYFQASERLMSKVTHNDSTRRIFARTVANELYCLRKLTKK
jgi:outer membrane protein assembly factor BamB